MLNRLIVPLDGSETAERALPYVQYLAAKLGARVTLVSVVESPIEFSSWAAMPAMSPVPEVDRWIAARSEYIVQIAQSLGDIEVDHHIDLGSPSHSVLSQVDDAENTAIVMASHGRTGFRRLVLGSVASRIVRSAPCPIFVVPAHDDQAMAEPGLGCVAVAVDGSEFAERAMHIAADSLELSGRVHLVRVIESPSISDPDVSLGGVSHVDYDMIVQYRQAAQAEATKDLERLASELSAQDIEATWEIREGSAVDEIRAAAHEVSAHVIVLATHGRSGFSRFFMGSVAEGLLGEIHRPLFLVGPEMEPAAGDED